MKEYIPSTLIDEYIAWMLERKKAVPRNTETTYRTAMQIFEVWIKDVKGRTLLTAVKQDFIDFESHLSETKRANTVRQRFSTIKRFYNWLELIGRIEFSQVPTLLGSAGKDPKPLLVPAPKDIFRMRKQRNFRVERAMSFEVLLSTGMRVAEFRQVRACDINFKDRPIDKEYGKKSIDVGGSILIDRDLYDVKNKTSRKVWINNISARLIKIHMIKHSIPPKSKLPIYFWGTCMLTQWMEMIGRCVYGSSDDPGCITEVEERKIDFSDIDIDDIDDGGVSSKLRKMIEKRQKEKDDKLSSKERKKVKVRRNILHPHALRHSFTCIMYYRNYYGERNQSDRLRELVGHKSPNTTILYLSNMGLIETDLEWKRLMNGRTTDWFNLR